MLSSWPRPEVPAAAALPCGALFFDVGALPGGPGLLADFVRFSWRGRGGGRTLDLRLRELAAESARGTDPIAVNRAYVGLLAGLHVRWLVNSADDWFAHSPVLVAAVRGPLSAEFAGHRAAGRATVLVTDTPPTCVAVLGRVIGTDQIVCAEPVVDCGGYLTGEVLEPVAGPAKLTAVRRTAREMAIDLHASVAVVGQLRDAALLAAVGQPRMLGDDPFLLAEARRRGWDVGWTAAPGCGPSCRRCARPCERGR